MIQGKKRGVCGGGEGEVDNSLDMTCQCNAVAEKDE